MDQPSKLPLGLNRSAHFAAVKGRVEASLGSIIDTLYMILNKDQRLGAKLLYNQNGLDDVVRRYLAGALSLREDWHQQNYNTFYIEASKFIEMPLIKNASELNWILESLPRIEMIGRILK